MNMTANWRANPYRSSPLLPRLRSEAGHALFVTSGAARKHMPFWGRPMRWRRPRWSRSRSTYAAECSGSNVQKKVNLLSPGPLRCGDARQRRSRAKNPTHCSKRQTLSRR